MSIYLTYRLRNGKRHGPYGMSGREYLGPVTVKDDLVYSQVDGSCLGTLVRRSEIPKKVVSESPFTDVETAVRSLFYMQHFTVQNIDDIKFELQLQFSSELVEAAVAGLVSEGLLELVCPGNYRRVV